MNDPAKADAWGPEREVRAELVRWLCVEREASTCVDPKGITVHGAEVVGRLDLSFADVPFPVAFFRCRLTGESHLSFVRIPALRLIGTWTRSITADGVNVRGDMFLRAGFSAEGEVRLLGAQIGGQLNCSGGTFKNPGKRALNAARINVQGDVFLREGFSAEGEVELAGAQIGGNVECYRAKFNNPGKYALSAHGVNVQGDVFIREGFSAEGEVRLVGAQIGGQLACNGGTFKNPGGEALSADHINVQGSVFLIGHFTAEGRVRLPGAQIGGNLDCSGGKFKNPGKDALTADHINVQANVFLGEGFSAEGEVRLAGAQIGGQLECAGGRFTALAAETATIRGSLWWRQVEDGGNTDLDLIDATVGNLVDDEASWPASGKLRLDGFVYDRISPRGPTDAKKRLEWLARLDQFTLQPYRQLAKVLHGTGDTRGARHVLFEMEHRRRAKEDRSWAARLWSWVLRATIGYGLKPLLALWWLLGLSVLGFVTLGLGYLGGAVTPTEKEAYTRFQADGKAPPYYPRFNALAYSLEHSFPFASLGQKDHWGPNPQDFGCEPTLEWRVLEKVRGVRLLRFPKPGVLRFFLWSQILAGWALATLFVAGLTGIVRAE